jgi:hypothetical protein
VEGGQEKTTVAADRGEIAIMNNETNGTNENRNDDLDSRNHNHAI